MQPEEKILKLRKPVTIGSGEAAITYDSLNLREPTAGELDKAMSASTNIGIGIMLIHLVAGVPKLAVEKLCQRDFTEANEYLGGFTHPVIHISKPKASCAEKHVYFQ